jgi:hypothetical protein
LLDLGAKMNDKRKKDKDLRHSLMNLLEDLINLAATDQADKPVIPCQIEKIVLD